MGPSLTVNDFIAALQAYTREAPNNGLAQVVLRSEDGETCFPEFSALNAKGLPGQHFLMFAPMGNEAFKARDAMKVT